MLDTQLDIEAAQEPTIRERANEELKAQIMRNAELICKVLDDKEKQIKKYENQCRVLAEEVDRLTIVS